MTDRPGPADAGRPGVRLKAAVEPLLAEIRKRWVVRLMITYALCFWLVVQTGALLLPWLGLPADLLKVVAVAGVLGLPATIVAAVRIRSVMVARQGEAHEECEDPLARMHLFYFLALIMLVCVLVFLVVLQTWSPDSDWLGGFA